MALHDRDYSRGSSGGWRDGFGAGGMGGGGGDVLRRIYNFLNWSFPIGRFFGIRVRVHILFVMLVLFEIWPNRDLIERGVGAADQMLRNARTIGLLFVTVLLHEFGHCFGCRSVGGEADEILMWPLGGLAFCRPPRRPWPEFVTVACGPLVNVAIVAATYITLLLWLGGGDALPVSLNPFEMRPFGYWLHSDAVQRLLADLFAVNYFLLLFNVLMIFYPFDGGRFVQIALWVWIGYQRSMLVATTFGMVGAVVVAGVGIWQGSFLLVLIALFGFITRLQQRRYVKYADMYEPDTDPRFAAAYETQSGQRGSWFGAGGNEDRGGRSTNRRPGALARWRAARIEKRASAQRRRAENDQTEIDRILEKVHTRGLASLTHGEKRTLQNATQRQRGG